jgi:hypothetical protein
VTLPKEFFTLQSMLTLTGATGAVYVVCNGLQAALNFNPKWLALAVAQVIALVGVQQTGGSGIDYFIGIINGFLIYCTAAGASAIGGRGRRGVARAAPPSREAHLPQPDAYRRRFLTSWF